MQVYLLILRDRSTHQVVGYEVFSDFTKAVEHSKELGGTIWDLDPLNNNPEEGRVWKIDTSTEEEYDLEVHEQEVQ